MPRIYGYNNILPFGGLFTGLGPLAPALLLPLLFNNNRGTTNIININTRRRNRNNYC